MIVAPHRGPGRREKSRTTSVTAHAHDFSLADFELDDPRQQASSGQPSWARSSTRPGMRQVGVGAGVTPSFWLDTSPATTQAQCADLLVAVDRAVYFVRRSIMVGVWGDGWRCPCSRFPGERTQGLGQPSALNCWSWARTMLLRAYPRPGPGPAPGRRSASSSPSSGVVFRGPAFGEQQLMEAAALSTGEEVRQAVEGVGRTGRFTAASAGPVEDLRDRTDPRRAFRCSPAGPAGGSPLVASKAPWNGQS